MGGAGPAGATLAAGDGGPAPAAARPPARLAAILAIAPPLRIPLPIPLALGLALAAAAPAAAAPSWHLGLRAGTFEPAASETYDTIWGETMVQFGVQAEARFRRGWFLALSVDRGEASGERVGPGPDGTLVPTGDPSDLTMTPIHLTVGGIARRDRPWSLYYGAGPSLLLWEDDNDAFPEDASDNGFHAVAGVRRSFARAAAAAEVRWSTIPDALGAGGASAAFDEDDWGGFALNLVLAFRLGR
jgi:hypothetical protein